jgi:hypothetical protein
VTVHDRTVETPPAALDMLNPGQPGQPFDFFQRNVLRLINSCKAGQSPGLSNAQMATAIGNTVTALGSETGPHDITIVQPLAALLVPGLQHT